MAGLGKHLRGHRKERVIGDSVSHHKVKDLQMGDQMQNAPMTSPVHPDLSSMAGGPSAPSSTDAASASIPSGGMSAPSAPSGGSPMGLKKGGSANWIKGAIKHPGSLRKALHVKEGQKIPAKKLEAASHKSGKMGQRARLAKTLKSFKS
jgi:hypothetical protein